MNTNSLIYVAGHTGMVGSAIVRALKKNGYNNILTATSQELNLIRQTDVELFFEKHKPEYVFVAAAKVGGIYANNTYKAQFLYENLMIAANIIHSAYKYGTKKLLFLGSSCIYPKFAPQPLKEEYLLTGALEPTNEPYAIAKIVGLKLCDTYRFQYGCNFISVMPTNLYGINDNYHPENSHVIPALIKRFHEAKEKKLPEVEVWGTGTPFREFLFTDDLADACIFLMNNYNNYGWINVGSGEEISIRDLAYLIKKIVGYNGNIVFNPNMPDGTPRKLLDCTKIHNMGWRAKTPLTEGLKITYNDFLSKIEKKDQ
ncbi:MAG: GDP-L-fucose synthase [Bacteroidales bacterium]|nr:GDP-L-fucose synthase [Bacteroidales bacterium]